MKVCFFGSYDRNYSRNRILISGLESNGVEIVHCYSNKGFFIPRYFDLYRLFMSKCKSSDIIFVAYRGHLDVLLAYIIAKVTKKKVVYDVFYALHDTYINDRRSVQPRSPAAVFYYILDKINCLLADKVICFTQATRDYFIKKYNLPLNKFVIIPVGGNNHLYKPIKHKNKRLIVEFHGWFTRMQGAEYFVRAAKKMEKNKQIHFWLIGNTVNYQLPIKLVNELKPTNLTYKKDMSETQLAHKIAQADICVGHLGATQKAEITISNKMYQGLACKLALIAGKYPATKELLINNHNCLFVNPADPDDLIKKIIKLAHNGHLRKTISNNGYILHDANLTNEKIGHSLQTVMENMISYAH